MADRKIRDERYFLSKKKGNGQIRREVWVDEKGKLLAIILLTSITGLSREIMAEYWDMTTSTAATTDI